MKSNPKADQRTQPRNQQPTKINPAAAGVSLLSTCFDLRDSLVLAKIERPSFSIRWN
uniref:Uncharacterized protein n=1 Tax=Solanum tuberosum TaxID=4113 RepID=M1CM39_SOLTU